MGEVTQYARQAYLGTGPKGLLRATKGSKLPHPYRGITLGEGTGKRGKGNVERKRVGESMKRLKEIEQGHSIAW